MFQADYRKDKQVSLGLIIPICNEEDALIPLITQLELVFSYENCRKHGISAVTCVFVDDGSKDNSVRLIMQRFLAKAHISAKIIILSRNFGHQAAITCGIDNSRFDLLAIIDADLQDPPDLIPDMIDKWRQGYEVIYAKRIRRSGSIIKKIFYWMFYRIYHYLSPIDVVMDSGDFCLISERVVKELQKLPESIKFMRGLRSWVGFAQTGIVYDRPERVAGKTKYNFKKLYQLATDGITSISVRPLNLAQLFAITVFFITTGVISFIIINFHNNVNYDKSILILLTVILSSNSFVLLCIYILGAYIGRTYIESKHRPSYIIQEVIDIKENEFSN